MVINIYIKDNGLLINGHGTNEPCARVSTLAQTLHALLEPKVKTYTFENGITNLSFKKLNESEVNIFNTITALFESLVDLYPRMVRLTDERKKETEINKV